MNGLNLYDYDARQMDGVLGRFVGVDAHAENCYSWSPYAYVGGNPKYQITESLWVLRILHPPKKQM